MAWNNCIPLGQQIAGFLYFQGNCVSMYDYDTCYFVKIHL